MLMENVAELRVTLNPKLLRERRLYRDILNSLMQRKLPFLGIIIILGIVLVALSAPLLSPYGPNNVDVLVRLMPPFWINGGSLIHPLGTDTLGRDILTRLMYGGRVSLLVGLGTTAFQTIIGVTLGLSAGYWGGLLDEIIMRLGDILLAFPFILLAMVTVLMLGPSVTNVILVLAIFGWVSFARVVRGETLSLREKEFIEAARSIGASDIRILFFHILPNLVPSITVVASFVFAAVVIAEATLSFFGLGIPPGIPDWGTMLAEGRAYLTTAWWMAAFSGMSILLLVLSINLIGDWLRDFLDPRLRF
jgi:peptide/nickel transport system permease protein